ncbi:glycosyltransferase family 4 protein [Verrucomicrobium sp. BvORR034]|uniref:glycosyltransferase family 4 protein n=1 Tax=Verrucomicrobium sp. BvORR034 TaxID=1396418 RepID=UPI0006796DC6|nr:glycosyltransferase family 4 protein [Verrucomicrobium sp. BvORR034]
MRVLFTNHGLNLRAGTELYVRDIAVALLKRGHEPWCWSTELGAVAEELRAEGILVVSSLADLPGRPDLIHGHHRLETTAAGLYFPDVPVISYCHGPKAWQERPCRLPNVAFWIAVDEACRERLVMEEGLDPSQVRVLLNFVDTERFPQRGLLPSRPERALVFSNHASRDTHVPVLRQVCEAAGIQLDVAGLASGQVVEDPGGLLPQYDLVFAKARAAIESMAAGCAVVQCDSFGAGRMVTPDNFHELRERNFGFTTMKMPLTVDHLAGQVRLYDAVACRALSDRVRVECSLDHAMDQLLRHYEDALRWMPPQSSGAGDLRRAALFLETEIPHARAGREVVDLRRELGKLRGELDRVRGERDTAKASLTVAKDRLKESKALAAASPQRRSWWNRLTGRRR